MSERLHALIMWAAVLLCGAAYLILPSVGTTVFLSPDETAVAVAARSQVETGSFATTVELVKTVPWLHPRSFVAQNDRIIPVGFLGMPALISLVVRVAGDTGMALFTPCLVLLTVIPLWSLARAWGRAAQLSVAVAWMTFPTVILYANRGLFPNLPVVCLTVWVVWLLVRFQHLAGYAIAGSLFGLAASIRPTEVPWMMLWCTVAFVVATRGQSTRMRLLRFGSFLIPCMIVTGLMAWVGRETYGSWFSAGYQLRDPAAPSIEVAPTVTPPASVLETWPFGFHPRNVWFNVKSYLLWYLAPWAVLSVVALGMLWRDTKRSLVGVAVATAGFLALLYGQGLYQDHVRVQNVSLANSFLRYMLPLVPLAVFGLGYLVSRLVRISRVGVAASMTLVIGVVVFGVWTATIRDDEGIMANRTELFRYAAIRAESQELLDPYAVVLSDRSDKIFFPTFVAASPLPSVDRIRTLLTDAHVPVALFIRSVTDEQLDTWRASGVDLAALLTAGNETLYLAIPL